MEDAAAIASLAGELGYPSTEAEVAGRLARMLGSPSDVALVATDAGGEVVGWVHVLVALRLESSPFAELGGLVVGTQARGRGVGRGLVGAAVDWARSRGLSRMRVRSRVERADAHRFYERLGFRATKDQRVLGLDL